MIKAGGAQPACPLESPPPPSPASPSPSRLHSLCIWDASQMLPGCGYHSGPRSCSVDSLGELGCLILAGQCALLSRGNSSQTSSLAETTPLPLPSPAWPLSSPSGEGTLSHRQSFMLVLRLASATLSNRILLGAESSPTRVPVGGR